MIVASLKLSSSLSYFCHRRATSLGLATRVCHCFRFIFLVFDGQARAKFYGTLRVGLPGNAAGSAFEGTSQDPATNQERET